MTGVPDLCSFKQNMVFLGIFVEKIAMDRVPGPISRSAAKASTLDKPIACASTMHNDSLATKQIGIALINELQLIDVH